MKALTVCQPYAELIGQLTKRVENRTWATSNRGWIYLHAGKSRAWIDDDAQLIREFVKLPSFGVVVAIIDLVEFLFIERINAGEYDAKYPWLRDHEHTNGIWCWIIGEVYRVGLWAWKGAQRLFNINNPEFDAESLNLVA